MTVKLAGRLPLQDMITSVIADARQKLAAAEDSKEDEKEEKKVKKLVAYEKKEHGGKIPSEKEEEEEKKASADVSPDEVEKLASALDYVGDMLKEADSIDIGNESHQGGMVLPTAVPPKGAQPYKHDASKAHNIPMQTGLQKDPSQGKAATQVENNHAKAPGGGGTQKEASIDLALAKMAGSKNVVKQMENVAKMGKESSANVDYILNKMAESSQGGMTLDSKSGEGPKPPSDSSGGNDVRKYLESSEAAVNMKKVDGKKIAKRSLADVLSEPAMSKAHDSKVHENLSNASKGGVKIAQAKALLQKIAAEGCTCEDKGDCKYCKMKAALKAKKSEDSPAGN